MLYVKLYLNKAGGGGKETEGEVISILAVEKLEKET